MDLFFRVAVYVPVLFLIAVVVVAQQHTAAQPTLKAAARRTGRWVVWSAALLALMTLLDLLFIGW